MRRLFIPGWGAPAALYAPLLEGWRVVDLPAFGDLGGFAQRIVGELEASDGPAIVAGHSMGAAVAVLAAGRRPDLVDRLVLVSPAGLPLSKPMWRSASDFTVQLRRRVYPASATATAFVRALRAPRAAFRLARAVHQLDLTAQLIELRARGVRSHVIGCATDTLTPAAHCLRLAELAGGSYRELNLAGGHMWMLHDRRALAAALA